MLPSVLTISMAMCVIYNVPRLLRVSAIGVALATIGAIPDFSRSTGLGVAELVVAGLLGPRDARRTQRPVPAGSGP